MCCFVCVLLRFDKKLFYPFVLRTYFYAYRYACVLLHYRLSTFNTQHTVWLHFPGMTSSLWKVNKSLVHTFKCFFLQFCYFLMFLDIRLDFIIYEDIRPAIYFNNQKNHCISPLIQVHLKNSRKTVCSYLLIARHQRIL